jgi:hypothetical protein
VLRADSGRPQTAQDLDRLARLIAGLHAHQARVLVRHVASQDDVRQFVRLGIDLFSMTDDARESAGPSVQA